MDGVGNGALSVLAGNAGFSDSEYVFEYDMGRKSVPEKERRQRDTAAAAFFAGRVYRGNVFLEYINERGKNYLKGSFTVELACLMPLILLVVFGVWSAGFYMHHKVWLTAAAYEAAVTGTAECVFQKENGSAMARLRAEERLKDYFEVEGEYCYISEENENIQVRVEGEVQALFGGMKWKLQAEGSSAICRPVEFIRSVRVVRKAADAVGRS